MSASQNPQPFATALQQHIAQVIIIFTKSQNTSQDALPE